eukprot:3455039-Amphidinium_carterae.1
MASYHWQFASFLATNSGQTAFPICWLRVLFVKQKFVYAAMAGCVLWLHGLGAHIADPSPTRTPAIELHHQHLLHNSLNVSESSRSNISTFCAVWVVF